MIVNGIQRARPGVDGQSAAHDRGRAEARRGEPPADDERRSEAESRARAPRPTKLPTSREHNAAMLSKFFIERPIFANVIAIVTMLLGVVSLCGLPIEQYPADHAADGPRHRELSRRQCRRSWPTRSPRRSSSRSTASRTCSTCRRPRPSDGSYSLTITFEIGTNLDTAQVLVQNRVAIAEPLVPEEVRRQGVTVKKQSTNIILVVSLTSPDNTLRQPVPGELRDAAARATS